MQSLCTQSFVQSLSRASRRASAELRAEPPYAELCAELRAVPPYAELRAVPPQSFAQSLHEDFALDSILYEVEIYFSISSAC